MLEILDIEGWKKKVESSSNIQDLVEDILAERVVVLEEAEGLG